MRGRDTTGSAIELKERVRVLMASGEILVITNNNLLCSEKDVAELILSLLHLMENVMDTSTSEDNISKMEALVRHFLSCYNILTSSLNPDSMLPSWLSHYNFMSLLNLPKQIREFGPVRNVWEGGIIGEGYLRTVKMELKTGLNKQWQTWLIDNLQIERAFNSVIDNSSSNDGRHHSNTLNAKIYKTKAEAMYTVQKARPFVASYLVESEDNTVGHYVLYRTKKELYGCKIVLAGSAIIRDGLYYQKITCSNSQTEISLHGNVSLDLAYLFLPLLTLEGLPKRNRDGTSPYYCYVRSDWKINK
jgi:hypothetical protein